MTRNHKTGKSVSAFISYHPVRHLAFLVPYRHIKLSYFLWHHVQVVLGVLQVHYLLPRVTRPSLVASTVTSYQPAFPLVGVAVSSPSYWLSGQYYIFCPCCLTSCPVGGGSVNCTTAVCRVIRSRMLVAGKSRLFISDVSWWVNSQFYLEERRVYSFRFPFKKIFLVRFWVSEAQAQWSLFTYQPLPDIICILIQYM